MTAIVIAYNSEDRIAEAIKAHQEALAHLDSEVLIIDNASKDDTVELARKFLSMGEVIANADNAGYGKAANQGILVARGRVSIILNDDARLTRHAVDRLLETLESDDAIALAGPRMVDEVGNPMPTARSTFPGPREEFGRIANLISGTDANRDYPREKSSPIEVAWLVGACMAGRTSVLREVGGFNPAFFLYAEDIDLCRRLKELGYRVVSVPDAVCVHTGSVSTSAVFSDEARIRRRADAREIYYRIWYGKPTRAAIHITRAIGLHNQPGRLGYHLPKVIRDGGSLKHLRFPRPMNPLGGSLSPEEAPHG